MGLFADISASFHALPLSAVFGPNPFMDFEVTAQLGAEPVERTPERTGHRNGFRDRRWDTRVGTIELRIPKVTPGSFFPTRLEPCRRRGRSGRRRPRGVSEGRVVPAPRCRGCRELDEAVKGFLTRPIEGDHPYLRWDATFTRCGRTLSTVPKAAQEAVAALIRTVFGQPDHGSAMGQLKKVTRVLPSRSPRPGDLPTRPPMPRRGSPSTSSKRRPPGSSKRRARTA
jgi:mutator family transposase